VESLCFVNDVQAIGRFAAVLALGEVLDHEHHHCRRVHPGPSERLTAAGQAHRPLKPRPRGLLRRIDK